MVLANCAFSPLLCAGCAFTNYCLCLHPLNIRSSAGVIIDHSSGTYLLIERADFWHRPSQGQALKAGRVSSNWHVDFRSYGTLKL